MCITIFPIRDIWLQGGYGREGIPSDNLKEITKSPNNGRGWSGRGNHYYYSHYIGNIIMMNLAIIIVTVILI